MRRCRESSIDIEPDDESNAESNATIKAVMREREEQMRRWERRRLSLADGQTFSACTKCARYSAVLDFLDFLVFSLFFFVSNLEEKGKARGRTLNHFQ
jgi:hypothetical protein